MKLWTKGSKKVTPVATKKDTEVKANTNVVLTDYEKETVLPRLALADDAWELLNEVTISDIYSIKKYTKDNGEKVKFLSMRGSFTNEAEYKLFVTIVVVEDSRFYMTLGNEEVKARLWRDQFINGTLAMQTILANMEGGSMSEEDIAEELDAINTFWLAED